MRLQIYVPQRAAAAWEPEEGFITWQEFQRRVARDAGSVTLTTGTRLHFTGHSEPVFILEAVIPTPPPPEAGYSMRLYVGIEFLDYAKQLRTRGYSVLLVRDGEKVDF